MPVQPTYPGVYVQEEPSGVRTITGVSTSTAVFIGRAKQGPLNEPVLCLSYPDFERTFSSVYADSDLARAVRLFFLNGGTKCYVMRIAKDATAAGVTLKNEDKEDVLEVTAKSAGSIGNFIRLAVSYDGLQPESTFNLDVFRWEKTSQGQWVKKDLEVWKNLSMDPKHPHYAVDYVNQQSKVISLTSKADVSLLIDGYSRSGRPVDDLLALQGLIKNDTRRFRISVDGSAFEEVDLDGVADLNDIQSRINTLLLTGSVTVTLETGPSSTTKYLQISSSGGDVRIEPAGDKDVSRTLMLGTAQGGIEESHYAHQRPAPNGIVFQLDKLNDFAALAQNAFNSISVDGIPISLTKLNTTGAPTDLMYQDGYLPVPNLTDNNDGIREKWNIIAEAINEKSSNQPDFKWTAKVWGSRLALIPGAGGDNEIGTLNTSGGSGTNLWTAGYFLANVRYYSLGTTGTGFYQAAPWSDGNDGTTPKLKEYTDAFEIIRKEVDLFNLLLLPRDEGHKADERKSLWGPASVFCKQQRAFLLMDGHEGWDTVQKATNPSDGVNSLRPGLVKDHSAVFYPRLIIREDGLEKKVGPSGAIAGLMARIDANRGVWKAPAGTEADIRGVVGLEHRFTDLENGVLNPRAVDTLRIFPNGIVNWGARTMDGDDDFTSEWKYIPVRRTALFIEESLYRGLKWVVFEPNDEPLWAQIRLNVGAFMHNLFRQGAFQGQTKKEAYFVKCARETTTPNDLDLGIVNIWVGFAPLKPAEFVIIHLQQMAGQIQV